MSWRDGRPEGDNAISPALKAVCLGVTVALIGLVGSIFPPLAKFEEEAGLSWLFNLRGPRPVPAAVVVVSIDKESSDQLGLPNKPRAWPRSLHARLVDELAARGAAAVVFDVIFEEPRDPEDDRRLADSVARAGNVVLFEYLKRESPSGEMAQAGVVERRVPPLPELARSAAALAPFPLPKVPVQVSAFWTFKSAAGDAATTPVAALQVMVRPRQAALAEALAGHRAGAPLPFDLSSPKVGPAELARDLRQLFQRNPDLADAALARLEGAGKSGSWPDPAAMLVRACAGPDSRYLDFYGPPRSVPTLAYHHVLSGTAPADLAGKVVFVGFSERLQPEQRDAYYTVYSRSDGLDMSGVEIAATAFGNLLEGRQVAPLPGGGQAALLAGWGLLLGLLVLLPARGQVAAVLVLGAGYVGVAHASFTQDGTWLPLVATLQLQLPVAFMGALLWRHLEARRDRERLRAAFGHFLPAHVVDRLGRDLSGVASLGDVVHGVCMATDAEQFTRLSESMAPAELHALLNRYYAALFAPVRAHGGMVQDVVGDAMMALWVGRDNDVERRRRACAAALEVVSAVDRFNRPDPSVALPTRLGLHCGDISLGSVGAADHFEYRAVGDIVNTASRIEGLNKYFGTRLLASQATVEGISELLAREIGTFRVAGKRTPVTVFELLGWRGGAADDAIDRCRDFAEGLAEFRARRWRRAAEIFSAILARWPEDGAAGFYVSACGRFAVEPPAEPWDGVVAMSAK